MRCFLGNTGKKGQIEIDWAISLGIFLVYLAFFFIYIRPALSPPESLDALVSVAKDGFDRNTTWSVEIAPFFVSSNITGVDEPVAARLPFAWQRSSFALTNRQYFLFDEGKIFFLANLTQKSVFWLSHTNEQNYSVTAPVKDLIATPDYASVSGKSFRADFTNSLLSSVSYQGASRVMNFNLAVDSDTVEVSSMTNRSTILTGAIAQYKIITPAMNHSSYVFAENSRILNYAYLAGAEHNLTVSATIGNYTYYYADGTNSGAISSISCASFFGNYVDFYDTFSGVAFITGSPANISVCREESAARLEMEFALKNETSYQIVLHRGDYTNSLEYVNYQRTDFGVVENITGLSEAKLNRTNATGYAALKTQWKYPEGKEFSFYVTNSSGAAMYTYEPTSTGSTSNVYVKVWKDYVIDNYGDKKLYEVRLRVW